MLCKSDSQRWFQKDPFLVKGFCTILIFYFYFVAKSKTAWIVLCKGFLLVKPVPFTLQFYKK